MTTDRTIPMAIACRRVQRTYGEPCCAKPGVQALLTVTRDESGAALIGRRRATLVDPLSDREVQASGCSTANSARNPATGLGLKKNLDAAGAPRVANP